MNPLPIKNTKKGPEAIIQEAIVALLRNKGWFCKETHGNMFQSGLPDVYACNRRFGSRWVEVKNPVKYCFTPAQLIDFPLISAHGVGIWILTAATEYEYNKLFAAPNWSQYLSIMR